jgi:NAD(P)H dehydrogenase (quinone)
MNFGFLVFGVTDYVSKLMTLHYGAISAGAPVTEEVQDACGKLGQRLAEWVAVYVDGRKDQHPLNKPETRMMPG